MHHDQSSSTTQLDCYDMAIYANGPLKMHQCGVGTHSLQLYPIASSQKNYLGMGPLQGVEGTADVVEDSIGSHDSGHGDVCEARTGIEIQVR